MVVLGDGRYLIPDNLYYTKNQHVYLDPNTKLVGLDQIGFNFLHKPKEIKILVEKTVKIGEPIAAIATDIGITTLNSPCSGKIKKINSEKGLLKKIENDTYESGFILNLESISEIAPDLIKGQEIEKWANEEVRNLLYGYYVYKVVEIGDSTAGKTAIKVRFTDNYFKQDLKSTLGVDFGSKELKCENISSDPMMFAPSRFTAKINVWDAAGQDHYEKIRSMYYRGAQGAILVYDVTNPISFKNLSKWMSELEDNLGTKVPVLMVGNKIDLERKVTRAEAEAFAEKNKYLYMETSAKTGENIEDAFQKLAIEIFNATQNN
jgi:small GTP-binding protein